MIDALEEAGIPILGTSPDAIDLAEDRERFQDLVERLNLKQPLNGIEWTRATGKTCQWRCQLSRSTMGLSMKG